MRYLGAAALALALGLGTAQADVLQPQRLSPDISGQASADNDATVDEGALSLIHI